MPKPDRAYHPHFDGMRGVAILLVLGFHLSVPGFSRGYLGVDVFFIVSGFLITTLLVGEHERTGMIRFPRFWMRRVLRLLPLYYLYVSICFVGFVEGAFRYRFGGWSAPAFFASLCFYFSNFSISNSIALGKGVLTSHLWSLAIEEQFYLLWPFACAFIVRRNARALAWALGLAALLCMERTTTWVAAAFFLHTRGLSLCAGCLAALYTSRGGRFAHWVQRPSVQLGAVFSAIAIYFVLTAVPQISDHDVYKLGLPPLAAALAISSASLWSSEARGLTNLLSSRALVYVGKISYGLYIWHMLCAALLRLLPIGRVGLVLATPCASLVLASLSYRFYERPFLRLKTRFAT